MSHEAINRLYTLRWRSSSWAGGALMDGVGYTYTPTGANLCQPCNVLQGHGKAGHSLFSLGKWRFPEMRVPPSHPLIHGFSILKRSILGYPHDYGNPQVLSHWVVQGFECSKNMLKLQVIKDSPCLNLIRSTNSTTKNDQSHTWYPLVD